MGRVPAARFPARWGGAAAVERRRLYHPMSTNRPLRRIFPILIAVTLGATCGGHPTEPTTSPLGQPFNLRVGESAVVPGGLRVTFDRVVSDRGVRSTRSASGPAKPCSR